MLQRVQKVDVPLESGIEEARGAHVLAFEQQRRHLAHGHSEGKARDLGCPMRPIQGLGQRWENSSLVLARGATTL